MKRFIIVFIVTIFFLAFAIGQCNNTAENKELEIASFYSGDEEIEVETEKILESVQEESTQKKADESGENDINEIVRLPAHIPSQLLYRNAYSLSYNKETLCPNWVAWHLIAQHVDGDIPRSNDYREDFDVPAPRATNEDYKGSGWSRGHMCPAGDNKWDATAMSESFLLSNMCPQDASLNSGVWNKIELDCRQWAKKYGDLYIVCGPLFLNKEHESIGDNKVVVPEAFFKVILCLQGSPKGIGFIVRNNEGKKKRDSFVNTIDDVERVTGMDFFPSLPDSIESVVEGHANLKLW